MSRKGTPAGEAPLSRNFTAARGLASEGQFEEIVKRFAPEVIHELVVEGYADLVQHLDHVYLGVFLGRGRCVCALNTVLQVAPKRLEEALEIAADDTSRVDLLMGLIANNSQPMDTFSKIFSYLNEDKYAALKRKVNEAVFGVFHQPMLKMEVPMAKG